MIEDNNPPKMKVEFFKEQKISNLNCFSNEGNGWDKSQIKIQTNIFKSNLETNLLLEEEELIVQLKTKKDGDGLEFNLLLKT